MKRSWGRLGAAVGAVALLAGGLVSVAAPAQAGTWPVPEGNLLCGNTGRLPKPPNQEQGQRICDIQYIAPGNDLEYSGYWLVNSQENESGIIYEVYGTIVSSEDDGTATDDGTVQKAPPPPPCWSGEAGNNCPVGGALRFAAPKYAMVGVPITMYAYASWRPDANSPAQPTNGSAVIRVDGEDYSGVEFKDGVAEWRFIPETEGMKEFTASGVLFSGLSGANAYIDTVEARTYVLEYDPAAYAAALKKKRVEVGDTYVITDPNQARSYVEDRYAWSVSDKSDDVCAVYETKKGAVKAKFNGEGKCTVIWLDKESEESGKYTFIAKK